MRARKVFLPAVLIPYFVCCACSNNPINSVMNISGIWKGTHHSDTTDQTDSVTYEFQQFGGNLSGRYTNNTTGGVYPISGRTGGNRVSVTLTDGSYLMNVSGTLSGKTISGTLASNSGQNGTVMIIKQ